MSSAAPIGIRSTHTFGATWATPLDAGDLTQSYFAELLEKSYLNDYDPDRGRFRVFLKTSVKHFLSKQREKSESWKRGGRADVFSLDARDGEGRYLDEPADQLTPEEIFERRWTLTLLERVLARLKARHTELGAGEQFSLLEGYLTGRDADAPYHQIAATLNASESAVKTAVHRLRREFGATPAGRDRGNRCRRRPGGR